MILRKKEAFTLIETVVALVIAGMILGVIYYGFSLSIRITKSGNDVLEATNIAKRVFYKFKNKKDELAIDSEYEQEGKEGNSKYSIKVNPVSFNINNNFDLNIEKYLKVRIDIILNKKDYSFDFYVEK